MGYTPCCLRVKGLDMAHHGLLVVDKPAGMTSRAVVNRLQRWFPRRTPLGHTGTLDPLATGVLVVCVGVATRLAEYVQRMDKVYHARLRLGARSDTLDADGTITPAAGVQPPDRAAIERALEGFRGRQAQVPPAYSAAKVGGRRAYALARRGQEVRLAPRTIEIYDLRILRYDFPHVELEVHCGTGTYIRSLARDLGETLGCGALIETLRRIRVGPFSADEAITLDMDAATARSHLVPLNSAVVDLPKLSITPAEADRLGRGQIIPLSNADLADGDAAALDPSGHLVAVVHIREGQAHPAKVFRRGL
jgi:tRNA pseudouridine55 synthase